MKITLIYDNTTLSPKLKPDWGFAALIETNDQKILFDTGGDGNILLHNMRELGIDPQSVDILFISHQHFDHIGGLGHFLQENSHATIYAPPLIRGIKRSNKVIYVNEPLEISKTLYSTGTLDGIEQSLCIKTPKGMAVVVGCSHPGVERILHAAEQFGQPSWLIGGFHGFKNYDVLRSLKLICPTHCTRHQQEILERYQKSVKGGVGKEILLD